MKNSNQLFRAIGLLIILVPVLSGVILGQSDISPTALGEEKYQELKANGLLPQPEQVPTPTRLRPENVISSEGSEVANGLLIPLDESFSVLRSPQPQNKDVRNKESEMRPQNIKCGTWAAFQTAKMTMQIQARPTLSGPEQTIQTAHFIVHWTTEGTDASDLTYATNVANYADNSWTVEVINLGWGSPPGDGTEGGGNDLYDIYIVNILSDPGTITYGVTTPEGFGPGPTSSYIRININLNTNLLQVTIAHEFNHACQLSYCLRADHWWYENTATWMEDRVYNSVNDYLNYLSHPGSPLTSPQRQITTFNGDYEYGGAIWTSFVHERYNILAPRQVWERMGTNPSGNTLTDIDWVLSHNYSSSLNQALNDYGIWRYFTGTRADAYHFSEGATFPTTSTVLQSHDTYPTTGNQGTSNPSGPGGTNYVEFTNGSDQLMVTFDGQDGSNWSASLIGYRNPNPSLLQSIVLKCNQAGTGFMSWIGNSKIVLAATVTEWNNPAGDRTHTYSANSISVAPFTNGAAPNYRNDDGSTSLLPLSFSFTFYGTQYNQVYINNNGNLSFVGPYGAYTSTGFPITGYAMVSAFWADIDTRGSGSGLVYYKSEPHRFTVIWDSVGYYNSQVDKHNTFEIIITDGTDPVVGIGKNVAFSYGDMQWTTGRASGGVGGFGGTPATVGANMGDGVNYALVGRFDHEGTDYDGAGGNADGVSYLDCKKFSFNVAQGSGTISGTKFRDDNENCTKDPGEPGLPGWTIKLEPGSKFATTDANGNYFFSFLEPNTYTVSEVLKSHWQQTCPLSPGTHIVVLTQGQTVTGKNFGNKIVANAQDLFTSVAGGIARPGFQKFYGIKYENKGTVNVNGTVRFNLPSQVSHLESSPGGAYNSGSHSVTWNVGLLPAGTMGWLWTKVQIPSTTPLGTVLSSSVIIEPTTGDANPADNFDSETQVVRGSFDPNDKQVIPQGIGPLGIIHRTDSLEYLIRFQNTGTDTAFNITIRDLLDEDLDVSTVVPGASSHPYTFGIVDPRELVFIFSNINLPDSNINEPASHGFIKFKIHPKYDVQYGADIINNAAIYFDFNSPVSTNTVSNRIGIMSSMNVIESWNLISNPIRVTNDSANAIFPSGKSSAFTYYSSYQPTAILLNGNGYWMKFDSLESIPIFGVPTEEESVDVRVGWNLIGSISEPIAATTITSEPPGIITSSAWAYDGVTYKTSDSIYPGKGYWMKVNQNGKLFLSATGTSISKTQIKIVLSSELPPAPPSSSTVQKVIPRDYVLEQNYPNPFNPITTIKYGLPFSSNVKLKIFNVLGQVVTTLKDEDESAGYKQIEWNSAAVASGIYFYSLEATSISNPNKSFTQVKKMILLR